MHTFRYLMPLDTMERISRQKLCEDFDNVLERVDKEDIGFVIVDDEGKEGHVLCPARWMEYCFDDDFGCIINSALRYSRNSTPSAAKQTYQASFLVYSCIYLLMNQIILGSIKKQAGITLYTVKVQILMSCLAPLTDTPPGYIMYKKETRSYTKGESKWTITETTTRAAERKPLHAAWKPSCDGRLG